MEKALTVSFLNNFFGWILERKGGEGRGVTLFTYHWKIPSSLFKNSTAWWNIVLVTWCLKKHCSCITVTVTEAWVSSSVDSCTEEPKCCSRPKKALVRTAPGSPAHLVSIQESRDPGPNWSRLYVQCGDLVQVWIFGIYFDFLKLYFKCLLFTYF